MLLAESAAAAVGPAAAVIERRIFTVRGHNVMLDSDPAQLYGVQTKAVKRAVNRNPERFPTDFLLILTSEEVENLRYQFGTSSLTWGGARYAPYAFTEQRQLVGPPDLQRKRVGFRAKDA